jgi:hypothetical protein
MNWKYLEGSGHVLVKVQLLLEGTRKSSVKMCGILSEIRTDHLPIKSLERSRYTNPLGKIE